MEDDIFAVIARKIEEAGSRNPVSVAKFFDILVVDLKGSIVGYSALYNGRVPAIGINVSLDDRLYMLVGWHELAHVFCGHIYESGFANGHADISCFSRELDDYTISKHEKTANLIAADVSIPDDEVLDVTGHNNATFQSYRRMRAYQDQLVRELDTLRFLTNNPSDRLRLQMKDLRRKIRGVNNTLMDMESELICMNCCMTFSEMAMDLGVNERIFRYKLEAMRLRGFDIDRQQLERYDRMFRSVI